MPALTPSFLFDFESNMQAKTETEYNRLVSNLSWQNYTRVINSASKRERVAWLLSTAMIKPQGLGGNMAFDDLVAVSTEYENLNAGAGLRLKRDQLEDLDGSGLDLAGKWAADIGAYMAYWPQKQVIKAILNGDTGLAYDGLSYFNTAHPYNPFDTALGTYANVFTSSSSGIYPGALKIDSSVTVETAFNNLQSAVAYIRSIKMPNGEDPRYLTPKFIVVPPALTQRAQQLTNARFIAQSVNNSGGGGSGDIESVITNWGFGTPITLPELSSNSSYTMDDGSTVTGSDTSWYIACQELTSSQVGALVYVDREPFKINYYSGSGGATGLDAFLSRARELEWHCLGRNVAGYGQPYLLFRADAS